MKNVFWVKFANVLIIFCIILLLIALVLLPFFINNYAGISGKQIPNNEFSLVFLYLTALPFLILLFAAKRFFKSILAKKPFCESNIRALHVISICAFIDFFLYAVGTIVILRNLLSLTIMIAAFMIGLTSLILAGLLRYALEIKKENDLTI